MRLLTKIIIFILATHISWITSAGLPPEAQRDVLLVKLAKHLEAEEWAQAETYFKQIEAITTKNNLAIDPSVNFYKGEVFLHLGELVKSKEALYSYINEAGSNAKHYGKALLLLSEIDDKACSVAEKYYTEGSYHNGSTFISGVTESYKKSSKKGLELYEKSAELGYARAMNSIGKNYIEGSNKDFDSPSTAIIQSCEKAEQWLIKALSTAPEFCGNDRNIQRAGQNLIDFYYKSDCSLPTTSAKNKLLDLEKKYDLDKWNKGRIRLYLAEISNAENNTTDAIKFYMAAAELEDNQAIVEIAKMYFHGKGLDQNYEKAYEYLERLGCENKLRNNTNSSWTGCHEEATFLLAQMYAQGLGVPNDTAWAIKLYRYSDTSKANYHAAMLYTNSYIIRTPIILELYQRASKATFKTYEPNDEDRFYYTASQYQLAKIYAEGLYGVPKDLEKAKLWLDKAKTGSGEWAEKARLYEL